MTDRLQEIEDAAVEAHHADERGEDVDRETVWTLAVGVDYLLTRLRAAETLIGANQDYRIAHTRYRAGVATPNEYEASSARHREALRAWAQCLAPDIARALTVHLESPCDE